jgi:nucleotide-binding universal stress UspA family protein
MKKILVPFDFSEPALEAYKFALGIASGNGSEVFVLNVIDIPVMYESTFGLQPYLFDASLLKELEESLKTRFDKIRSSYPENNCSVSFSVRQGPVSLSIRSFIDSKKIDLVIMGTHGSSGIKETFVGSNTEKIVRHSPVPVISLRKAPPLSSIKNIVYPTTFQPDDTIVHKIKELQHFFGATLHLLFVNTPHGFKRDNQAKGAGEAYAKTYDLKNYTVNIRNDYQEEDGIMAFAYEIKAGLVAMETHGRKGLSHMFNGSITEEVVNHYMGCPVWTYSRGGHAVEHPRD